MDASMDLFMKHFIKYVYPTKERPVLLLLDNHTSHMSINTLNIAKENHVHLLSFPAHCSHRLQPLDISVYGPMKKFSSSAALAWMLNHPGKTMTIYNIPTIISPSFPLAATPINIKSGFEKAGIVPFGRDGFHARADYDPRYVTDRVDPNVSVVTTIEIDMPALNELFELPFEMSDETELILESSAGITSSAIPTPTPTSPTPSSSPTPSTSSTPSSSSNLSILEELPPIPKAEPRTAPKTYGRRKRTSVVLTDTLVKSVIEAEKAAVKPKAARKILPLTQSSKSKSTAVAPKKKQTRRKKKAGVNEDSFCPECGGAYSKTKEDWIRCSKNFGLWACESCVDDRGEQQTNKLHFVPSGSVCFVCIRHCRRQLFLRLQVNWPVEMLKKCGYILFQRGFNLCGVETYAETTIVL